MSDAMHAAVPKGWQCSSCSIACEACPDCYAAWWTLQHLGVVVYSNHTIAIDGTVQPLPEFHKFAIRWAMEEDANGNVLPVPVLYVNGRRCTKPWAARLVLDGAGGGDVSG